MQMAAYRTDLFHSYVTEGSIRCPVCYDQRFPYLSNTCIWLGACECETRVHQHDAHCLYRRL